MCLSLVVAESRFNMYKDMEFKKWNDMLDGVLKWGERMVTWSPFSIKSPSLNLTWENQVSFHARQECRVPDSPCLIFPDVTPWHARVWASEDPEQGQSCSAGTTLASMCVYYLNLRLRIIKVEVALWGEMRERVKYRIPTKFFQWRWYLSTFILTTHDPLASICVFPYFFRLGLKLLGMEDQYLPHTGKLSVCLIEKLYDVWKLGYRQAIKKKKVILTGCNECQNAREWKKPSHARYHCEAHDPSRVNLCVQNKSGR